MNAATILQSFAIGAVISTIICLIVGFKHKPVKLAKNANEYLDKSTVNITNRRDDFYNSSVEKTPINRN